MESCKRSNKTKNDKQKEECLTKIASGLNNKNHDLFRKTFIFISLKKNL